MILFNFITLAMACVLLIYFPYWLIVKHKLDKKVDELEKEVIEDGYRINEGAGLITQYAVENITLESHVYQLLKALDDIDTTSDLYKSEYQRRCDHIDEIIKAKDNVPKELVEKLYNTYYNTKHDILTPVFKNVSAIEEKDGKKFFNTDNKIIVGKFFTGDIVYVTYSGKQVKGKITSIAAKPVKGTMMYRVQGTKGKHFESHQLKRTPDSFPNNVCENH